VKRGRMTQQIDAEDMLQKNWQKIENL